MVAAVDAEAVHRDLLGRPLRVRERSLSGLALMLGLRGRAAGLAHHTISFPADYDAEFDDVFRHRRPVRDPTLYVSAPARHRPRRGAARTPRAGSCSSTRRRSAPQPTGRPRPSG